MKTQELKTATTRPNWLEDVEFKDVDLYDYPTEDSSSPGYEDAYISSAACNGRPLTQEELDALNNNRGLFYELIYEHVEYVQRILHNKHLISPETFKKFEHGLI